MTGKEPWEEGVPAQPMKTNMVLMAAQRKNLFMRILLPHLSIWSDEKGRHDGCPENLASLYHIIGSKCKFSLQITEEYVKFIMYIVGFYTLRRSVNERLETGDTFPTGGRILLAINRKLHMGWQLCGIGRFVRVLCRG